MPSMQPLLLLALLVAISQGAATAQALHQPLPEIRTQSAFHANPSPSHIISHSLDREGNRKSRVETFLTGAIAGGLLGTFATFFVTCTYSTDRACPVRTIGAFALGGGILALLATI
jgi:hypothetical protein